MRELTDHKVNPANDLLTVKVVDDAGAGGAHHHYDIEHGDDLFCMVKFQNGPINEHGINGVTQEALLVILIDRLRCFQNGPFSNSYNATALVHCEAALDALKARTLERMARGVEGRNTA